MHPPGIELGPPAWQASILPLNQLCCFWEGPFSLKNQYYNIVSGAAEACHYLQEISQANVELEESRRPIIGTGSAIFIKDDILRASFALKQYRFPFFEFSQ
jgi:hypothetical protein